MTGRMKLIVSLLFALLLLGVGLAFVHGGQTESFMPHGYCLRWDPQLLTFFVLGNALVAVSYYSIPTALWIFVRKRKDLVFNWMFKLFAAFIFWCGTTHVMKLWTIWHANYWVEAWVDFLTGVLSVVTAILLWPLIPKALSMRSPQQWEEANRQLAEALEQGRRVEQELLESQRALTEARDHAVVASEFKSRFLANMSHEIRTPLNGVLGMLDLLKRSPLDATQREQAGIAYQSAQSLLNIINEVLDFSKIEADKLQIEETSFDLLQLVEGAAELLGEQARENKLCLVTFVDPKTPRSVIGDPGRVRQILLNLLGNAIKFTERGDVVLRVTKDEDSSNLVFTVSDTGIGMSDSALKRLFEPFVQGDGTITRRYGGTGLGLSISKKLVELMGGTISAESTEGKGSTFIFYLPLCVASTVVDEPVVMSDLRNVRLLSVNGSIPSIESIRSYVTNWGMHFSSVPTGEAALSAISSQAEQSEPFDIAIVDAALPDMDAFTLADAINTRPHLSHTKLILLGSNYDPGAGEKALSRGFSAVLHRPVKQSRLLDCIVKLVTTEEQLQNLEAQDVEREDKLLLGPVLVAEDNAANQKVISFQLRKLGYACHCVGNGAEAVEAAKRVRYSLILMDVMMPDVDGIEATRQIRKNEALSGHHVPIAAVTAQALDGDRQKCMAFGMDDYISKPFSIDQLRELVAKWITLDKSDAESISCAVHAREAGMQDSMSISMESPIDLNSLRNRCPQGLDELVKVFIDSVTDDLAELEAAIASKDTKEAIFRAHSLEGSCATFCAGPMHILCLRINSALQDGRWSEARFSFETLKIAFRRAHSFLQKAISVL